MIKILLIDDDKFSLLNLQTTLSNLMPGSKILNADNGETGIQLAQKNNPDVILLDVCMPGMDGIEVCRHLKSDIRTQNIPVLFATSLKDDIEVGKKAIEAGGEGFLSKPFNKVELTAQIRAMVKIKKTHLTEKEEKKKLQKLINQHTKQLKAELEIRKKTEKTQREQEQALKQAQEIANLGSWEINFKSNTLNWSENHYRLFGFEPFEVIPTFSLFIDMVFPDDRKIIKTAIERLKRKKKIPQFQYRIITKDGTLKWLQNYVAPVYNRNELIMLKGVDFDITKRQTAEEELQKKIKITREHECLSQINAEISTELIDVSLVNIDDKIRQVLRKIGEITQASRSFLFLFKNNITATDNTHEWCGTGVKSIIKEMKDIPVSASSWWMKKLIAREYILISNLNKETNLPQRDKEMMLANNVVSLLVVPIFKGDEILGFLGLNSSDKEFEWNDFQIQIIKAISNSIANAISSVRNQNQLIIAKEKAEESDRLKSAFLANMSHEIRTPMNGIVGFLDLMQNANLSTKERKMYIQMVKKSGDRLLTTISDIIEISKIESGQTPVIRTVENITEIIDYLVNTFQPEAESKGLQFKLSENVKNLLNKPVSLNTDKIKLEIILKNLIGNAIKFTSEGEVEFGYTLTHNSITFCVKDTGPGIKKEKLDIIFDRFVQADLDITRPYEGAGLGLSITRAYAEMLHGDIEVKSEPGKGSEFYFTLNHDSLVENKLS